MTKRQLSVTGFANGGAGIAHDDDGRVVFVSGALPGETVTAHVTEERASYAKATVIDVLEASPHRRAIDCPAAAAGAGCCDLAFTTAEYAAQLRTGALSDVLTRIGGFNTSELAFPQVEALVGGRDGWRARSRLAVDRAGKVGVRAARSADVVTERCVGPVAGLVDGLDVYDFAPGAEVVAAADDEGRRSLVELAPIRPTRGRGRAAAQQARARRSAPRAQRLVDGLAQVSHTVGDHTWTIDATGFWQAHRAAPATYAATVREFAEAVSGDRLAVWDLYGGVGVLSAGLTDRAASIDLVETDAGAIAAAGATLGNAVKTHRGDVARAISGLAAPDLVIADPPRKGGGRDVINAIAAAAPSAIIHVGCDIASFARDLRGYVDHGYQVQAWRAFDAFPRTHHVEAIALLCGP